MRRARALLALVIFLVAALAPAQLGQAAAAFQASSPSQQAQALLARMTPEEKIGQLFLVTFNGTDVSEGTKISDLVTSQHIGGVVLSAANDNFIGPDNTVNDIYRITTSLQQQVWDANYTPAGGLAETATPTDYIPLFVGVTQEGDGFPTDQIVNGVTPLPDEMAIGATWKPDLSRQVGAAFGSELSAMGFNLIFGPSLDVLNAAQPDSGEDYGTRSFGGDPYWVGLMGQAYIQGLHEGSDGRMAVISKNFPGRGAADRPPEEEVATVRKSLDQLEQVELVPFSSVAGDVNQPDQTTDGLLVSHIRYDFQGAVRPTTRPFSFDAAAIDTVLKLPAFIPWRENGGLLVSDDLGSLALRRFYDTTGQAFDPRQVARNAFLAGNDLLYLNNFIADGDPDSYTTILRTLTLFVQKYREDRAFAERVDASVQRILQLKFKMYPNFNIDSIIPSAAGLSTVGQSQQIAFDVARQGAALISPDPEDLQTVLPRPPGPNERIVFISDARSGRQCSRCPEQVTMAADALQSAVNRLYGPQTSGQVSAGRMSSYTLTDLQNMLTGTSKDQPPIEQDLGQAGWIVFAMLNKDSSRLETGAIRRFLTDRPDLYRNKRVIVFAFNAPYYLDATDISKVTAYYGMFSKIPAFIDVAARVLFQELVPAGALPVSVPGIGYDLSSILSPDPQQVIPLSLDVPEVPLPGKGTPSPPPTPVPVFKLLDTLPLRAGPIYDHNHNLVPDGTPVRFLFTIGGETGTVQQIDSIATDGIARASYRITMSGLLEARVESTPAVTSQLIRLDISPTGGIVTPIVPTLPPTTTPTPTETITPTSTATPTPPPPPPARPGASDWMLAMLLVWGSAIAVFAISRLRLLALRWSFRWAMTAAAGGLLAYLYFAVLRLVNEDEARQVDTSSILLVTFFGVVVGTFVGWLWRRQMERRAGGLPERHPTGPR